MSKRIQNRPNQLSRVFLVVFLVMVVLTTAGGCLPLIDRFMYVIKGNEVPAPYNKLSGKRTAIVCVSEVSAYGPDSLSNSITRLVGAALLAKVKKIQLVSRTEVDRWIDENGWDNADYVSLGKGVKADRVIAIEVNDYSIHEGKTLHKGRVDVVMTVYELDHAKGPVIGHQYELKEYEFPKNGRPAIQSTDRQFEEFFLAKLCRILSHQFIKHDRFDSFADEAMLGF